MLFAEVVAQPLDWAAAAVILAAIAAGTFLAYEIIKRSS